MRITVNRNYKYRIYPNKKQSVAINRFMGCCRFVWNHMLSDEITNYRETGRFFLKTPAQYKADYPFLKDVDSQALANEWCRLNAAFKAFFNGTSKFPQFKSRKHPVTSYRSCVISDNIRIENDTLRMPKLGDIKIKLHRQLPEGAKVSSVTIMVGKAGDYFAVLTIKYDIETSDIPKDSDNAVGLDYKSDGLYMSSDGEMPDVQKYYRSLEKRIGRVQKQMSRKQPGSHRYEKCRKKLARLCSKAKNQRADRLHKLSKELADRYDVICVEDLDLKEIAEHGRYRLGKNTLDNGYGMFLGMLQYKLEERGKYFVKIDRYYPSTRTCCKCGHEQNMPLSKRVYVCESCGSKTDRDLNAAINIKNRGLHILRS